MKTYKTILMLASILFFAACNNQNNPENNQTENNQTELKEGHFNGTVVVTGGNVDMTSQPPVVSDFTKDEVYVTLEKQEDLTYNIVLKEVNFSNMMPNSINMAIPSVSIQNEVIALSTDDEFVNPLLITSLGSAPDSNYEISQLTGNVKYADDGNYQSLSLSFVVTMVRGDRRTAYPTTYQGEFVTE